MPCLAIAVAVAAGLFLSWLLRRILLRLNRRLPALRETSRMGRVPLRLALCLTGIRIALALITDDAPWRTNVDHILLIALIASVAWLAVAILLIIEALMLMHYSVDVADNRRARRLRTQVILARRIGIALVVILALGIALLTFPDVRALGAGILASAGLISIVAGLAVQSALVNVFAGVQLAFTDAIRVDDVVVVQKEWGRIEEITLTYVVVHIWDDRRLILPSTYFTTTPFENWTRGHPPGHRRHQRLRARPDPRECRGQRLPVRPALPRPRRVGGIPAATASAGTAPCPLGNRQFLAAKFNAATCHDYLAPAPVA